MNSRGSWSIDGIEPSVRERAEAAARRAGMSLEEWLNSAISDNPASSVSPRGVPSQDTQDVAEIHQRLDSIARQIDQFSQPSEDSRPPANQLNNAISRLDERLARITTPPPARPAMPHSLSAAATPPHDNNASSLDLAVAEILARQGELERDKRRTAAAADTPASAADISGLEQQLSQITSQIQSLQPERVEQSIAAFRSELANIRQAITEAMPRHAIESIEREIRQLAERIDASRHGGSDDPALSGVERALGEIHQTLRTLTPAEQLAGFDEAIRHLGGRLDTIVRTADNPASLQELEGTISALRNVVANVASNEALAQLGEQVQSLAAKVDQLSQANDYSETFSLLEQRIATLTTTLQTRTPATEVQSSEQLEGAMRTLSERLDRIPVGNDSPSAFAHLEQRVSYLLERLESSADHRSSGLGRVEEGLQDVLRHLEQQQAHFAAAPARIDSIKRELSDIRNTQTEADRHTQDSLEAVHNTLGHVVDRLAMIENDLRTARATPRSAPPLRPELPNPVQAQPAPQPPATPAPPFFKPAATEPPPVFAAPKPADEPTEPRARSDAPPVSLPKADTRAEPPHSPLNAELPPDHPLEPGTRLPARTLSPSERIAASEEALSELPSSAPPQPASASSFIAAARRAAQAAAKIPAPDKPGRAATLNESIRAAAKGSPITSKIRSLLVGASVVVIVLGSFKMAMSLMEGGSTPPKPVAERTAPATSPSSSDRKSEMAPPASMTSPTPIDRQTLNAPQSDDEFADGDETDMASPQPPAASVAPPPNSPLPPATPDVTGSIPNQRDGAAMPVPPATTAATVQIPSSEKLPDSIGGPTLRAAALKGDPAAAYEVATRYAEGKGVTASLDDAAKWYDRAAQGGIVPAIFRLGTFYEKGLSVKKDVATARRYYLTAAERGSAKAMHNLAVLDADGGGKGPDYRSASQWFRNAAERGVADSQFNLGILYARGIGVEQNLAESYKWFSLAAAQGDADAGRKRDDVAKRLDAQSLAAAKLAVQNFVAVKQPDDAVTVASPAGGWDAPLAKTTLPKTTSAKTSRTARAAR